MDIKILGKKTFPRTHATKVMCTEATTQPLVVWEIDGEQYVEISANTRGTREFTKVADLYVDESDCVLKARHAPLKVTKDYLFKNGLDGVPTDSLENLDDKED